MRKSTTTKLNAKTIVNQIVETAGVSLANAQNIFNLFSTAWNTNRIGLLTVLDTGIPTVKRSAKKAAPRASKKVANKPVVSKNSKSAVVAKTAKKAAPVAKKKTAVKLKKSTTSAQGSDATVNA